MSTAPRLRRSEEHTSELQSLRHLVCRLLLEKKKNQNIANQDISPELCLISLVVRHRFFSIYERILFVLYDTATTDISTLSLHDALPISCPASSCTSSARRVPAPTVTTSSLGS